MYNVQSDQSGQIGHSKNSLKEELGWMLGNLLLVIEYLITGIYCQKTV